MDNNEIIKQFSNLGIKNNNDLYEYIVNNQKASLNKRKFDLTRSNETIEFMALFLTATNHEVTRFYFEKANHNDSSEKFRHWFIGFMEEEKWCYYEPILKNSLGQFSFDTFDEFLFFASNKLNDAFDKGNTKFSIMEIEPLNNESLDDDIKQSQNSPEVFINLSKSSVIEDAPADISEKENVDTHKNTYLRSLTFFIIAFVVTLVICLLVLFVTSLVEF